MQDDQLHFYYRYGPSFILTIISFVTSELTGVLSVYLYISLFQQAYRKERDHLVSPIDVNNEALQETNSNKNSNFFNIPIKTLSTTSIHKSQALLSDNIEDSTSLECSGNKEKDINNITKHPYERECYVEKKDIESDIGSKEESEEASGGSIIFSPPFPQIRKLQHEPYSRKNFKFKNNFQQNPFLQFHQMSQQKPLQKMIIPQNQLIFTKNLSPQQQTQLNNEDLQKKQFLNQKAQFSKQNVISSNILLQKQLKDKHNKRPLFSQQQLHQKIQKNLQDFQTIQPSKQTSILSSSTQQDDKANSSDTENIQQKIQSSQQIHNFQKKNFKHKLNQGQGKDLFFEHESEQYSSAQNEPLQQSNTELQKQLDLYKKLFNDLQKQVQQRPYFFNHQFSQQQHRLKMYQHQQQQLYQQHLNKHQLLRPGHLQNNTGENIQQLPSYKHYQMQQLQAATTATSPMYKDISVQYSPLVSSDDRSSWSQNTTKKKQLKKNSYSYKAPLRTKRGSKNQKRKNDKSYKDLNNNPKNALDNSGESDEDGDIEDDDELNEDDDTLTDGSNFVIQLKNSPTLHRTFRHSDFNLPVCVEQEDFPTNTLQCSPLKISYEFSPFSNRLCDKAKSMHELRENNSFTTRFFMNYCTPDVLQALVQPIGSIGTFDDALYGNYLGRTTPV